MDSNSFIVLSHYFPEHFPSFWEKFNQLVSLGKVISVREVYRELDNQGNRKHLLDWVAQHKQIFLTPTPEEMAFVNQKF